MTEAGQDAGRRAVHALGPWGERPVDSTPETRAELIRNVATTIDAAVAEARREERQAISALIRKRLVYDSQRAVSWHEIQDCLEAIGPASAPEGEK